MRIESLAECPEHAPSVARWCYEQWGRMQPGATVEGWTTALRTGLKADAIPAVFVALEGDAAVGSVALVDHDMDTRAELGPWLAALYVLPDRRDRWIGIALARHAIEFARRLGVTPLYTYLLNERHVALCERLGWRQLSREVYKGHEVTVMALDLGA